MLIVRLEVADGGDRSKITEIGRMHIGREGPAPATDNEWENVADYHVAIFNRSGERTHVGRVEGFKRLLGPWALVRRAVEEVGR